MQCQNCKSDLVEPPVALERLRKKINEAFKKGEIKVMRGGATGPGKAWEEELGIIENNEKRADFDGIEIKSLIDKKSNPLTLVSKKLNGEILKLYGLTNKIIYDEKPIGSTYREEKPVFFELDQKEENIVWYLRRGSKYFRPNATLNPEFSQSGDIVLDKWNIRETFGKDEWLSLTILKLNNHKDWRTIVPESSYLLHLPHDLIVELIKGGELYYEIRLEPKNKDGKEYLKDHGPGWRLKRKALEKLLQQAELISSRQWGFL